MTRAVGCLVKIGLPNYTDISVLHAKHKMSLEITESLIEKYIEDWSNTVNRPGSIIIVKLLCS